MLTQGSNLCLLHCRQILYTEPLKELRAGWEPSPKTQPYLHSDLTFLASRTVRNKWLLSLRLWYSVTATQTKASFFSECVNLIHLHALPLFFSEKLTSSPAPWMGPCWLRPISISQSSVCSHLCQECVCDPRHPVRGNWTLVPSFWTWTKILLSWLCLTDILWAIIGRDSTPWMAEESRKWNFDDVFEMPYFCIFLVWVSEFPLSFMSISTGFSYLSMQRHSPLGNH